MSLLSWWKGNPSPPPPTPTPTPTKPNSSPTSAQDPHQEVPDLNGAVEVRRRPEEVTVFEFGSIAASGERATLAGYCPVSDDLEPCRWEIVPAAGPDAPQFRIVF